MKEKLKNFWEKIKKFWKKVWDYIKYLFQHPKTTLPAFLIAESIFWIPVWVPALIYFITGIEWMWGIVGAVCAFWAGPITPAIALQIGFIALVERWFIKIQEKKNKKEK